MPQPRSWIRIPQPEGDEVWVGRHVCSRTIQGRRRCWRSPPGGRGFDSHRPRLAPALPRRCLRRARPRRPSSVRTVSPDPPSTGRAGQVGGASDAGMGLVAGVHSRSAARSATRTMRAISSAPAVDAAQSVDPLDQLGGLGACLLRESPQIRTSWSSGWARSLERERRWTVCSADTTEHPPGPARRPLGRPSPATRRASGWPCRAHRGRERNRRVDQQLAGL